MVLVRPTIVALTCGPKARRVQRRVGRPLPLRRHLALDRRMRLTAQHYAAFGSFCDDGNRSLDAMIGKIRRHPLRELSGPEPPRRVPFRVGNASPDVLTEESGGIDPLKLAKVWVCKVILHAQLRPDLGCAFPRIDLFVKGVP